MRVVLSRNRAKQYILSPSINVVDDLQLATHSSTRNIQNVLYI